jgi:transposase
VIGKSGKVTHSNGRTSIEGRQGLYKKREKADKVAVKAGNGAFVMAKEMIVRVGCEVVIPHPGKPALIYGSMKKRDKEDSLKLARIIGQFRDEQLPKVALPGDQEMRRRKLIAAHARVVKYRTRMINLLHGLFPRQGITTIVRKDLARREEREEAIQRLSGQEREEAVWAARVIAEHEGRIAKPDEQMAGEREGDEQNAGLMKVPGIGPVVSLAFVAFIGDGSRFENASQVSNNPGLAPRVDISGRIVKYGGITKRGNTYVRALLVQASWTLIKAKEGGVLKERYVYMTGEKGVGKKGTIVAIGRRVAELLWTLLRNGSDYESRKFAGHSTAADMVTEALAG